MIRKLLGLALLITATSASAATITVDSLSDASGCSLRNAIVAANTNTATVGCAAGQVAPTTDSIVISVAGTYSPTTALPATTEAVTITGTLPNFILSGTSAGATASGLTLNSGNTTVRGLVIQNFGGSGIEILGFQGIVVAGNRIGTDASATTAAPNCTGVGNAGGGIHLLATTSQIGLLTIGGSTAADRNVISGNQCSGILAEANQTALLAATAEGNYIGTNYCGCDSLPNTGYGVQVEGNKAVFNLGTMDTFTTVCNGHCNVIASNALGQVKVNNGLNGTGTNVRHNVIGANANMTAGLPTDPMVSTGDGVLVASQGTATIDGNIIVHSSGAGVRVDAGGAAGITSNRIGATVQGSTIPNAIGVRMHETSTGYIYGNTIVASTGAGVWLDGSQNVVVRGNNIGYIGGNSITPAGNQGGAVLIANSAGQNANNNVVGGADQPNAIAYNTITGDGPAVSVASGVSNVISQNSIYENFGTLSSLAIDLGADGPTPNDPCDSDTGPNNRQNAPVVTAATRSRVSTCNNGCTGTRIFGTLVGQANTQYKIEFFTNAAGSPTPGQTQGYLGFTNVTTDASCNASFVAETSLGALVNGTVVATATSPTGDTSEVSAPVVAWPGQIDPRYDSNNDGFADILWRNFSNGANAAWMLDGSQNLLGVQNLAALPNTDYHIESSFYLASQGANTNILWRNYVTGANAIWTMNGVSSTPMSVIDLPALPNVQYSIRGTADFNGDGFTDILWRNDTTGVVAIWLMNGTSYVSTVNLPSVALPWTIAGTGDFNDDGRMDIVWHNNSTAANAIWFMDGTAYQSTLNIQSIPNTAYVIAAIADYNGDHHPDILWHNTTTGANAIWLMNGTALGTIANLPTVSNTSIVPSGPK
jgi:hypothetical protein